jgi:signal transduction histidine kinase
MSSRTFRTIVVSLVLVTAVLVACLTMLLPLLAVLAEETGAPLWATAGPVGGAVFAFALVVRRDRSLRRGGPASQAANLPAQLVIAYVAAAVAVLALVALVERDPISTHRPVAVFLCGPVLIAAHGLVLRALIQPALMAEAARLASSTSEPTPRARTSGVGVLAIRPSLTLVAGALVAVALALVGGHAYSLASFNHEKLTGSHLTNLLRAVSAQVANVPAWQAKDLVAEHLSNDQGAVVMLDQRSRIVTPRMGLAKGTIVTVADGRCHAGGNTYLCATSAKARLAALYPSPVESVPHTLSTLAGHLLLIAFGFFIFAAVLGWGIGHDISRDFQVIANQLRAMASQDRLDLGRPVAVTSVDEVGDLTEALEKLRIRLEAELDDHHESLRQVREAEHVKSEFLANVSQELRTPLTTLCGYSQLLLDGSEGDLSTSQQEDLRSIHRGGQQLLDLINDVLDISVIESGGLHLTPERVDVGALCSELVDTQRSIQEAVVGPSGAVTVELRHEIEEGLPPILADPRRLTQTVQNLLSNALKFTAKGSVTVQVKRAEVGDAPGVVIQVQDTGAGIGQADLPHVFDHYRQAGDMRSRRRGSGLGLAICKHLVELHGGTISVTSVLDQGSTFTVALPVDGPTAQRGSA